MQSRNQASDQKGRYTVLVVEDDEQIRRLILELITAAGYRVLEAACGRDALDLAKQYPNPIHLLLTDVVMPGMNGPVLMDEVRHHRRNIPVLFISGYGEELVGSRLADWGVAFLQKPFIPRELLSRVEELLEKNDSAAAPVARAAGVFRTVSPPR